MLRKIRLMFYDCCHMYVICFYFLAAFLPPSQPPPTHSIYNNIEQKYSITLASGTASQIIKEMIENITFPSYLL